MQTRHATLNDLPFILEQLWAFNDFCNTKHSLIPIEEGKATEIVAGLIQNAYFIVIETYGGKTIGFICGVLHPHMLNPEIMVLTELFWWVMPEARGTMAGAQLFIEFEAYGRRHANWIIMTLEHNSPVNPESLEKRDFHLKERNYLLEV